MSRGRKREKEGKEEKSLIMRMTSVDTMMIMSMSMNMNMKGPMNTKWPSSNQSLTKSMEPVEMDTGRPWLPTPHPRIPKPITNHPQSTISLESAQKPMTLF